MLRVDYESVVIQDIQNFQKREELNLNPWYQRRSVWTPSQKAYLINSLFENKPIPTCYVRHYLDVDAEKSIKEIVDGQQRIRAVLSYLNDEFTAPVVSGGKKVKFSGLSQSERQTFRMKKLSIGYLVEASDTDVIDIFGRLNSVAKTLNEQEKRNAKFSGAMKQFCLRQGAQYVSFWRDTNLFTANDISRMLEVQFTSELTYNLLNGLSDFSQARLNKMYEDNDEEFPKAAIIEKRMDAVMMQLVEAEHHVRNTIFSRSPLFFSLCLALDQKKVGIKKLRSAMETADEVYNEINTEGPSGMSAESVAFYNACVASTQRIAQRKIRHEYLLGLLKG
jgi:uncharacterized protein with ParB-like and HNH nuclease domain